MTYEPDITIETLNARIVEAFRHIYLGTTAVDYDIAHNDDETITVDVAEPHGTAYRAYIDSDDDGFLRFTTFDEDDDPIDDDHTFLSIRIKAY